MTNLPASLKKSPDLPINLEVWDYATHDGKTEKLNRQKYIIIGLLTGGSKGRGFPKIPECSPRFPNLPWESLGFPSYPPPLGHPPLKNPITSGWKKMQKKTTSGGCLDVKSRSFQSSQNNILNLGQITDCPVFFHYLPAQEL